MYITLHFRNGRQVVARFASLTIARRHRTLMGASIYRASEVVDYGDSIAFHAGAIAKPID